MKALLGVLLALTLAAPASAASREVRPGESIQAAIDAAGPGDVIRIQAGRYRENLRIAKPLTLSGVDFPTISGGLAGDTIRIASPEVVIDGLIVADSGDDLGAQNAGIYLERGSDRAVVNNCQFSYVLFGLWIEKSDDVVVSNNVITGKRDHPSAQRGNGIQLYYSMGARILANQISFVRDGIYVDVSDHALFRGNRIHDVRYGTHYMNSHHNTWEDNEAYHNRGGLALMMTRDQVVRNNRAWGNSDHGIMLRTIQDSVIEGNVVAGNARGFFIYDAEYNVVRNNLVVNNRIGVHLWAGSIHNAVDGNDFIGNQTQVKYVAARDELWGIKEGNHWSNYLGWDRDGDGIGDLPYEANDLVDRLSWQHPMMKLLLASPAVQTLRLVARQFPLLRAPSVVDRAPRMAAGHDHWRDWFGKRFAAAP